MPETQNQTVKLKIDTSGRPKRIIFCIPGSNFSGTFFANWTEFVVKCMRSNIIPMLSHSEDAIVYYARNKVLNGDVLRGIHQKPFDGKIKYDYLMWIDSDIIFNFDQFQKLLSYNLDIVSGIYMMKGGQNFATVQNWDVEFFKKNGYFQFLTEKDVKEWQGGLMDVSYTGFGFMLVKYDVFESLEYPWFRPNWQQISEDVRDFSSEDVSWCQNIKKLGFHIYVDPSVRVGHEKRVIL